MPAVMACCARVSVWLLVSTTTASMAPGEAIDGMASGNSAPARWSRAASSISRAGLDSPKIIVIAKTNSTIPPRSGTSPAAAPWFPSTPERRPERPAAQSWRWQMRGVQLMVNSALLRVGG